MWKCPNCNRVFQRNNQSHSCKSVSFEEHFFNKELAKNLFDNLFETINRDVGKSKIVSLPCCIHLFGEYDFLAALPKRDGLEIRFALNRTLITSRLKQTVQLSHHSYKNCVEIKSIDEIDNELIDWLKESYYLKKDLT